MHQPTLLISLIFHMTLVYLCKFFTLTYDFHFWFKPRFFVWTLSHFMRSTVSHYLLCLPPTFLNKNEIAQAGKKTTALCSQLSQVSFSFIFSVSWFISRYPPENRGSNWRLKCKQGKTKQKKQKKTSGLESTWRCCSTLWGKPGPPGPPAWVACGWIRRQRKSSCRRSPTSPPASPEGGWGSHRPDIQAHKDINT